MLVKIDDLVPGMALGEDVILPNGATLLNSSAILTEQTINHLKKYNFSEIQIAEGAEEEEDIPDEESSEQKSENREEKLIEETEKEEKKEEEKKEESKEDQEVEEKVEAFTLPKIVVIVENDGYSALLRIEPADGENERFTVLDLKQVLLENNVVHGIDEARLKDCVTRWGESQDIFECENIAQATLPTPAKEGMLDVVVEHVKNSRDLKKARNAEYYWELVNDAIPIQRVDSSDTIGKKDLQIPDIPGINIHGDEIASNETIKTEVKLGDNVEEDAENNCYKSLTTGITYYAEGTLGVVPINFDGAAELALSPDNMKAELTLHPPGEDGNPPTEESIKELIAQNNITDGINEKQLAKVLSILKTGVYPDKPIPIAKGRPAVDGDDGKVKFLFRTDTSLKPEEDEHGNVDYKNVSIIQSVVKGTRIAKLIPQTEGTSGKDILGNTLPCTAGTPATLPAGPNTAVKPDDENTLIAEIDGNVRFNGQVIEIFEGFTIPGDIDYSTGNIEYDKSVIIGGDIKSGFLVKCGGDLEVSGTIEDAHIEAGGHVLGKLGFNGHGKGIIECHGDVNLMFISNQTIRSQGNVIIAKEAINSTIYARGTVTVSGTNLSIAGGIIVSRDGIVCHVVGNENGIHTLLEAGLDFHLKESLDKEDNKLSDVLENRDKLLATFKKLNQLAKAKKQLPKKEQYLYTKIKKSISDFENEIHIIEEKKKLLLEKMAQVGNPFIKIEHAAFPGTVFKIGNQVLAVQKEVIGPKMIRLVNDEIHIL